ncbi:MAG TPA: flagellar filament capping protein FliD [Telluria sp.]
MGLSSAGIGSNLPIDSIITQLMALEQRPLATLDKKVTAHQAKLSAIGTLKSALATFQTAVRALSTPSKFQVMTVKMGDATVASPSAAAGAAVGTYSLEVSQLAQAQKLASAGQASTTAAIGAGTLTFDLGTISAVPGGLDPATGKYAAGTTFTSSNLGLKTVTIDPADTSLTGIRDAINKAGIGVSASIVNDGSATPYRLVLTETATGKASSMQISVSGSAELSSLLAHDPAGTQAMSETLTAQNAEFKLDGLPVSSATNAATGVIEGVTLNLTKTNVGSPASFVVGEDATAIADSVKQFVTAYNAVTKTLKDLTSYNEATKVGAALNGDATARSIQAQLRNVLSSPVATTGAFKVLTDIGISVKAGVMAVDETKLKAVIATNFDDVAGLFSKTGGVSGYAAQYDTLSTAMLNTEGPLTTRTEGINKSIKSLETSRLRLNDRLAMTETRLRAQYAILDTMVSRMNTTSSYLTQQLAQLANIS